MEANEAQSHNENGINTQQATKCNNTYGRSRMRTHVVVRELRADSTNACKSNANSNTLCSDPHK